MPGSKPNSSYAGQASRRNFSLSPLTFSIGLRLMGKGGRMKTKTTVALLAAGIVSLAVLSAPHRADADWRSRQRDLDRRAARTQQAARGELQRDRAELHKDYAELERDRADLRRLYRSGASRSEIGRKRGEIRQDAAEIAQDRGEIRDDLGQLRRTGDRYGYGRGNDGWNRGRDRWDRNDNGRWGWGNNRPDNRDRWDYSRD